MTLAEWSAKYDEAVVYVPLLSGAVGTCVYPPKGSMFDLARLTDYAISTLSGPVAWLRKRNSQS